jgi:glutamate racemase
MSSNNKHPPSESQAAIGIFDSGVGGLSVLREIHSQLPDEALIYVADSAHAPYGQRSTDFIEQRADALMSFLIAQHVKAVVVACNTVTGVAISQLRQRYAVPLIAIEPAIKPAANLTRSGVVGVLATTQTLASASVHRLIAHHGQSQRFILQPCPGWVECVERGDLYSDQTQSVVMQYVQPLLAERVDTLVLGCTHYPFLRPIIEKLAGPSCILLDPASAVAREVRRQLESQGNLSPTQTTSDNQQDLKITRHFYYTTGSTTQARRLLPQLMTGPWLAQVQIMSMI